MAINVYWACLEDEWLRFASPEPLSNVVKNSPTFYKPVNFCPAFKDSLKNVFALRSIYNYEFEIVESKVTSSYYDQPFFDRHVYIRSAQEKCFSFNQYTIFFTDSSSLEMVVLPPYLEDNNISERCKVFSGKYDIGKWCRNLEFSFQLKSQYNSFKINEGEIYSYVQFNTKEKINLVQFMPNQNITPFLSACIHAKENKTTFKKLQYYYNNFKFKKLLLQEIRKNII